MSEQLNSKKNIPWDQAWQIIRGVATLHERKNLADLHHYSIEHPDTLVSVDELKGIAVERLGYNSNVFDEFLHKTQPTPLQSINDILKINQIPHGFLYAEHFRQRLLQAFDDNTLTSFS